MIYNLKRIGHKDCSRICGGDFTAASNSPISIFSLVRKKMSDFSKNIQNVSSLLAEYMSPDRAFYSASLEKLILVAQANDLPCTDRFEGMVSLYKG